MSSKKGLGKGFGSLLPDNFDKSLLLGKDERVQKILIQDIKADPTQPRKSFDEASIDELAQSIKRYGILQPLVVTEADGSTFVIIAGERRFRAAKIAGLTHVPVLVRSIEELERLEIGLIENMQRVDLSPLEQALSIARLHEQFNMTLQDIAVRLGKAHTTVVNTVRLLQLPDFATDALTEGSISEGHARAVLALKDSSSLQKQLVSHVINDGWSVRQAEAFVKRVKSAKAPAKLHKIDSKKYEKTAQIFKTKYGGNAKIADLKNGVQVRLTFKTNKEFTHFLEELNLKITP